MGSGWLASTSGFCCPTLPVASEVFSCFFLRRFLRWRIQLRIDCLYHSPVNPCNFSRIVAYCLPECLPCSFCPAGEEPERNLFRIFTRNPCRLLLSCYNSRRQPPATSELLAGPVPA